MLTPTRSESAKTRWMMAMSAGGKRGIVSDMNVVPLIDILLVLLVIFMIIPVHNKGLDVLVPQSPTRPDQEPPPEGEVVVVQVLEDGSLRIHREPVSWDRLGGLIEEIFKWRATSVACIRGDGHVDIE